MPIAVFANKVFEVTDRKIYTIEGFNYGSSLDTEKQDASGKKPSTYVKGPALDNFGFTLILDASQGVNPRREKEEWEAILEAAIAHPFILGKRPLGKNKWLLVDVQTPEEVIDNVGNMLYAKLDLKFDEYVRPGSASQTSSGTGKGINPGIKPIAPQKQAEQDKTYYKRNNPNMSLAAYQSLKGGSA